MTSAATILLQYYCTISSSSDAVLRLVWCSAHKIIDCTLSYPVVVFFTIFHPECVLSTLTVDMVSNIQVLLSPDSIMYSCDEQKKYVHVYIGINVKIGQPGKTTIN